MSLLFGTFEVCTCICDVPYKHCHFDQLQECQSARSVWSLACVPFVIGYHLDRPSLCRYCAIVARGCVYNITPWLPKLLLRNVKLGRKVSAVIKNISNYLFRFPNCRIFCVYYTIILYHCPSRSQTCIWIFYSKICSFINHSFNNQKHMESFLFQLKYHEVLLWLK